MKLVFKQFPLDTHSQAALAAAAALAAHRQGKFWPLHDAMFANRTHLSRQTILALATATGVDTKRFVQDEEKEGEQAGVDSTPTVFVDGRKYNGDLDLAAIRPIIEGELKRK